MSTSILENIDMLVGLYDFEATHQKTLSFKKQEFLLLFHTSTKRKNWWQVLNQNGECGFVPSNYVETVTVHPKFYWEFLQNCQRNLSESPNDEIRDKLDSLLKAVEERCLPLNNSTDHIVVSDTTSTTTNLLVSSSSDGENNSSTTVLTSPLPIITQQSVYELIEKVRINTKLSHDLARVAVITVIDELLQHLLPSNHTSTKYLSAILKSAHTNYDQINIDNSHDAVQLRTLLADLIARKDDAQQRSWTLHDDEQIIRENLTELIGILSNADVNISRNVFVTEDYESIRGLVQYYQMETRWPIRQLLLQTFGVLCSLDCVIITILLNSVLPCEIASGMITDPCNSSKLSYAAILLTMIFSMADQMPLSHHDTFNEKFLRFLLGRIEADQNDTDDVFTDSDCSTLFLNLVLAFNLQFDDDNNNPVLDALEKMDDVKNFTEHVLLLLNREEDPVRIFDHTPSPPHSILKLFVDLLSRATTAQLFYTNDVKVLTDIVLRNMTDLCPTDSRRLTYIQLCGRLVRNTNYRDIRYKTDELLKCFTRIFSEEHDDSFADQKLLRDILHEFPDLFQ